MKNLGFLLSIMTLVMLSPNVKAARDGCTNVTVKYEGNYNIGKHVSAWHVTKCGSTTGEDYFLPFEASGQTYSLQNSDKPIEIASRGASGHGTKVTLTGSPITIICTCDNLDCAKCKPE